MLEYQPRECMCDIEAEEEAEVGEVTRNCGEKTIRKPDAKLLRYRKRDWFAPTRTYAKCHECTGLCCRVSNLQVALTFAERKKIISGELGWKVKLGIKGGPNCYLYKVNGKRFKRFGGIVGHPRERRSKYHRVTWYLAKKANGECLYFDAVHERCGIYRNRPKACKVWFCSYYYTDLCEYAESEGKAHIVPGYARFKDLSKLEVLYDGAYPHACSGTLTLKYDGEVVYSEKDCCNVRSGTWFDDEGERHGELGVGELNWCSYDHPDDSKKFPETVRNKVKEVLSKIKVCCGGCTVNKKQSD